MPGVSKFSSGKGQLILFRSKSSLLRPNDPCLQSFCFNISTTFHPAAQPLLHPNHQQYYWHYLQIRFQPGHFCPSPPKHYSKLSSLTWDNTTSSSINSQLLSLPFPIIFSQKSKEKIFKTQIQIREEKEIKGIRIGKEGAKLSLFANDIHRKSLETSKAVRINKFSKGTGHKNQYTKICCISIH